MVGHLTLNQSIVGSSPTSTSNICNSSNGGPRTVLKTPGCRFESDGLHQNNKMIGYLYLITNNITGLQYVGKTYSSVEKRWKDHIKKSKTDIDRPLYRAISKYGSDNFLIEIVGTYEEGDLEDKEVSLIAQLDTYRNGYNATLGGDGRRYLEVKDSDVVESYNTLKSIKETSRSLRISEGSVRNILVSNNISTSLDTKAKASIMTKACGKSILWVEYNTTYKSCSDCARDMLEFGFAKGSIKQIASNISRVTTGDRKTYLGFTFKGV